MIERGDCVQLALACVDVCRALDRGLDDRQADQLSGSVFEAIHQQTVESPAIEYIGLPKW